MRDPDGTFTAYYYEPYGNLFAFRRGTSTFYVASDHLGTPRVIADSGIEGVRHLLGDRGGQAPFNVRDVQVALTRGKGDWHLRSQSPPPVTV